MAKQNTCLLQVRQFWERRAGFLTEGGEEERKSTSDSIVYENEGADRYHAHE